MNEILRWGLWGVLLAVTNGFSTLVSRARNTPSYSYHGVCATFNHATWFVVNYMFVNLAVDVSAQAGWQGVSFAWGFYTVCSTIGSVVVHYISINYFERGDRRVGQYKS